MIEVFSALEMPVHPRWLAVSFVSYSPIRYRCTYNHRFTHLFHSPVSLERFHDRGWYVLYTDSQVLGEAKIVVNLDVFLLNRLRSIGSLFTLQKCHPTPVDTVSTVLGALFLNHDRNRTNTVDVDQRGIPVAVSIAYLICNRCNVQDYAIFCLYKIFIQAVICQLHYLK